MNKEAITASFGIIGGFISSFFGSWDSAIATLIGFMIADYLTGMIVAGIFKASPKTAGGGLESKVGFKGLCKKGMILVFVMVAYRLDLILGVHYIKDATVIAFIFNETISLTENAGLMGVPIVKPLKNAIELLKNKESDGAKNE